MDENGDKNCSNIAILRPDDIGLFWWHISEPAVVRIWRRRRVWFISQTISYFPMKHKLILSRDWPASRKTVGGRSYSYPFQSTIASIQTNSDILSFKPTNLKRIQSNADHCRSIHQFRSNIRSFCTTTHLLIAVDIALSGPKGGRISQGRRAFVPQTTANRIEWYRSTEWRPKKEQLYDSADNLNGS